jgi:CheY-like chemotaxis protein
MSEARPAASEPVRWNTAAARAISSSRFHNQRSFGELQSEADGIDPAGVPYHLTAALSSLGIKRRQSVLVVDEDQRHCMVLRDLLSKEFEGLNVDVVHDADAALELLNAGSVSSSCPRDYGLVLIKGPQISGWDIVEFVHRVRSFRQLRGGETFEVIEGRSWQASREVEFAAVVEDASELDRLEWSEVGREGENVLTKPIKRGALRALVGAALLVGAARQAL